uniref:Uncharacterized protein n=1 Tax=uncultured Thiotrichaceae bacterium TaxID=298394 RepID=A0A6S6UM56_9GAMM|nr:MAG: Unknown protein [uncultured Thiotrichaceae bacterium]
MLVFSLFTVLDYWRYDEVWQDVTQLMRTDVTAADIEQQVAASVAENNPDDARMYLSVADTFGYSLNNRYEAQITELENPLNTAARETVRFIDGFIDGDASSGAGVAGAITADFTVVGDVRDLKQQYDLYAQGQDVNELIVTLAGVGVGLTAATVVSAGTAAPVKSGASALKIASRGGKLTPKLQKLLVRQGSSVFDYPSFFRAVRSEQTFDGLRRAAVRSYNPRAMDALSDTARQVNNVRQSTSMVDTITLLRYVETADDLRRLEKVSSQYAGLTKGILKLAGKGAIGTVRVLRRSTEFLVGLVASLISLLATLFSVGSFFRRK